MTGEGLRTAIAKKYYSSFDSYIHGFNLGKAIQHTSCRDLEREFKTVVQEKKESYKSAGINIQYYDAEKKNIDKPCMKIGFWKLSEPNWGGRKFDYLVYAYFYEECNEIVRIYVLENSSNKKWFSTTERKKTDTVQSNFEAKIESQPNERTNIFLEYNGWHYDVLGVKSDTTEKQLNEFNRISTNSASWRKEDYVDYFRKRKQRYFETVKEEEKITGDGMCYWNAIAEAFFRRPRIELPEGMDIREEVRGRSFPPPPPPPRDEEIDLTGNNDRKVSPKTSSSENGLTGDPSTSPVDLTEDSTSVPIQRFLREFLEQYKKSQNKGRRTLNRADGVLGELAMPCLRETGSQPIIVNGKSTYQDAPNLLQELLSKTGTMGEDFRGKIQITRSCTGRTSDGTTLTYTQENVKSVPSYVFQIGREDWTNGLEKMLNETIKQWGGDPQNRQHQQGGEITFEQATNLWDRRVDSIIREKNATLVKIKKTVTKFVNGRMVNDLSSLEELERPYNKKLVDSLPKEYLEAYVAHSQGNSPPNTEYSFVFYLECETGKEKQTYIPQTDQKYLAIQLKIMMGTNRQPRPKAPTLEEYRNIITEEIRVGGKKFQLTGMVLFGGLHYTAIIQTQNGWFLVNDEAVTPLRRNGAPHWYGNWEGRSPYLLFYSTEELATARPIGLINGRKNICYANAVLQNLANLPNIVDTLPQRGASGPSATGPSAPQRSAPRNALGRGEKRPSAVGTYTGQDSTKKKKTEKKTEKKSRKSRAEYTAEAVRKARLKALLPPSASRLSASGPSASGPSASRIRAQNQNYVGSHQKGGPTQRREQRTELSTKGDTTTMTEKERYKKKVDDWVNYYKQEAEKKKQNSKNRMASFPSNRRLLL